MTFAVMITTHDRCEDLRRTCEHLAALAPAPDEVLICADGCKDGTVAMLRARHPAWTVIENAQRLGSVASRDRMLRRARAEIVVSLDDDSHPLEPDFLPRLQRVLDAHPEAAVIALDELRDGGHDDHLGRPRDHTRGAYVSAYANCGAAMRRAAYLRLPGFPAFFGHMYEEPDYALQCYAAGLAVWHEPGLVVRHRVSPLNRHDGRRQRLHARNELWSVLVRCPWPWLPAVALFRIWRQLRFAATRGVLEMLMQPVWWLSALEGLPHCLRHRDPVPWPRYRAWMRLARHPLHERGRLAEALGAPDR
jgi:GT2 family glycosyltransferase